MPDGVEYISEEAFMDCKSLKHVKLSKRLKQIGQSLKVYITLVTDRYHSI